MSEEYDVEQVRNRLAKVLAQLLILSMKQTKTGGGGTTEARWVRYALKWVWGGIRYLHSDSLELDRYTRRDEIWRGGAVRVA